MRKSTFIFIVLSGLASFFNYAVYPVLARVLSADEFVDMTVALALFTQLSSFMLSIVALTIGLSKQERERDSKQVVEKLQAILTHLFLVIIVVLLATAPLYLNRIHLPAPLLLPICAMLALSISMSVISGFLNGQQKLVKLGISIAFSAFLQFVLSVGVAATTKSGALTMNAMAFGSLLAIALTYRVYRNEKLPRFSSIFTHGISLYKSKEIQSLIRFTILASLATLVMNILLIADLLLVNSRETDSKIYADTYIISRVVFFSGTLFIWPFLSNINIYKPRESTGLFYRLAGLFSLISICAIGLMVFFGHHITQILLGSDYGTRGDVKQLAIQAIIYKFIYLLISTLTLFFIVMRNYWAVKLPLILAATSGFALLLTPSSTSTVQLIVHLNIAAAVALLGGLVGYRITIRKPSKNLTSGQ